MSGSSSRRRLDLQIIDDENALERISDDWRRLLDRSARSELMLAPDWALTWWRHYGEGRRLCFGLWRHDNELVGLVPLCGRDFTYRPGIPFRRLELMGGSNEDADGVCGEYLAPVAAAGWESDVAEAFAAALAGDRFGVWDELVIEPMDGDSPMTEALTEALGSRRPACSVETVMDAYYLPLPEDWETFLKGLHGKRRNWFRRARKDFLAWVGDRDCQLHRAGTPEQVRTGMGILADLHEERWQEAGEDGSFASKRFAAFHDDYALRLLEQDKLDLLWLTVDGVPVAAHYSFVHAGKVYFYQSGRSMEAPSNVRLGIVMFIYAIEEAMRRGLTEYDFLGGNSGGYKTYFTSLTRPLLRLRVAKPGVRELTRLALRGAVRSARGVSSQLRELLNAPR